MNELLKHSLWQQFGAALDMLENAIMACPDKLWNNESLFWYWAYHTLFFVDYYLSTEPDKFFPPSPFTLSEFEAGKMPERVYTKDELLDYVSHCRSKCRQFIGSLTDELAAHRFVNSYCNFSMLELTLDNMRHIQHHTAQLNGMLRKEGITPPRLVAFTKASL